MRIRNVENKTFMAQFVLRLFAHNFLKDSQQFLPKGDYERRHGDFPRYFSGWYLFVPSKDLEEGELIHKKLNGIDLVAYRNSEGKAVIHSNRCTHMDGLFSGGLGRVEDGKLICGYHKYGFENGEPQSGPKEFREDPANCIPCHPVTEVNDLVMFWFDAESENGIGEPTWDLDIPDLSHFERRAFCRSITPTHMAPLHENIVDDQHFVLLHEAERYKSVPQPYFKKHRFKTANVMKLSIPNKIGPFKISDDDTVDVVMDSEFFGLGIHINTVDIKGFKATVVHCTTPIEDEVTEWTLSVYMEKREWWPRKFDAKFWMGLVYPWGMIAQTYNLHTQDRRVFFQEAEYRFYDDAPKGFEKVNMFRRWIHEELIGEKRPMRKNSIPTKFIAEEGGKKATKKKAVKNDAAA